MKVLVNLMTFNPKDSLKNYGLWEKALKCLKKQRNIDLDICVCDCISNGRARKWLENKKEEFGLKLIYIDQRIGVNFAWNVANAHMGDYDWIGFNASDVYFEKADALKTLIDDAESTPDCAIISPQVTQDNNIPWKNLTVQGDQSPSRVLVGQGYNGHFTLFGKAFLDAYGKKRVDVLVGPRTEPFNPYLCAAINKSEYVSHKVLATHEGFGMERDSFEEWDKPEALYGDWPKFHDMIRRGHEFGLGFEELYTNGEYGGTVHHLKSSFGKDGYSEDKRLYYFLKKNLFLNVDYKSFGRVV